MCRPEHVQKLPDLTLALGKPDGKVARAYIARVDPTRGYTNMKVTENTISKMLQLFWKTEKPVALLQLRKNMVPTEGGDHLGAGDYTPQGLYFDIDVTAWPSVWPADLSTLGTLRWVLKNCQVIDFLKKGALRQQPNSKYHRKMLNYFSRSHSDPNESIWKLPSSRRQRRDTQKTLSNSKNAATVCRNFANKGSCDRAYCPFMHPMGPPGAERRSPPRIIETNPPPGLIKWGEPEPPKRHKGHGGGKARVSYHDMD